MVKMANTPLPKTSYAEIDLTSRETELPKTSDLFYVEKMDCEEKLG